MKYPIGFRYVSRSNRKNKRVTEITAFMTVTNHEGHLVKTYYEGVEICCGQKVSISNIVQTTIDMGEHID